MTLVRRIKLGFGAILAITAVMVGLNGSEMLWVNIWQSDFDRAMDRSVAANQMMSLIDALNEDISYMNDATARGAGIAQLQDSFEADATQLVTLVDAALQSVKPGSEDAAALENLQSLLDQYQQAAGELFTAAETHSMQLTADLREATSLGTQLGEAAAPYTEGMKALLDAKLSRLDLMTSSCVIITAVLGVMAVGGGIASAWVISRRIRRSLDEAVSGISTSASELSAVASQVAASAAQTAASINETTVTAEEVKQTAVLSHEKASMVAENSQNVAHVAEAGRSKVEGTIAGIERMQGEMDVVSETINRLSEQTQAAGEVITTVNDLAEQSNLLSVNASIEAAKAGEYGKGFTVVAQEVKSLAEQSKQAVTQVRSILSDIQKASSTAVQAAGRSRAAVEAGSRQSLESGEVIQTLAESALEAVQEAMQISASSQQQLAGMEQISQAIASINEAGGQSAAGTRQVEQEVKHLQDLALQLKLLVDARAHESKE